MVSKVDGRMIDTGSASIAAIKSALNIEDSRFTALSDATSTHVARTDNPHATTKAQVGLANVDNTSDANKPISSATQAALDLKANQASTYTKAEVDGRIQVVVGSAPSALDTLQEIAGQLQADESAAAALTTAVAGKLAKSANLSDLANAATARTNLGLGTAALSDASAFMSSDFTVDIPTAGSSAPLMNSADAAPGISTQYSRDDHVHPTDTSRAAASHGHVIGDITDLTATLAGKAAAVHTHTTANVTGLEAALSARSTGLQVRGPVSTPGGTKTAYGSSYAAPAGFAITAVTVDAMSGGLDRLTFDIAAFTVPGGGGGGGS